VLDRLWGGLEAVAIDHAIAEPLAAEGGMAVVPGFFDWDDVGGYETLAHLIAADAAGTRVLGDAGQVLALESRNALVVPGSGRTVAVLGIDDVVVIDTPDAVLVTTRDRAQEVKAMVDEIRRTRPHLL
jgi:mannose-1-phosphate guanylyltransferase